MQLVQFLLMFFLPHASWNYTVQTAAKLQALLHRCICLDVADTDNLVVLIQISLQHIFQGFFSAPALYKYCLLKDRHARALFCNFIITSFTQVTRCAEK